MPVNRLKIMAFSFGAGIAGLAGSVFAAVQTGAFPRNFGTAVLIMIYAVVILGGTGSLTGMVIGAIVINATNQVLDSTSPPNLARTLFYLALIAAIVVTMWPSWQKLVGFLATVAFGFGCTRSSATCGHAARTARSSRGGYLTGAIKHFVLLPTNPGRLAVYGYLMMIVCVIVVVQLKGWWRVVVLVPTLYLAALVWENLLIEQPVGDARVLFGAC